MVKVRKRGYSYIITVIIGLIWGFTGGVVSMEIFVSYKIDSYHEKIARLEASIADYEAKLGNLEDSVKNKKYVLKDIELMLSFNGDDLDKIAVEKAVKEKYNSLLGKEIKTIDVDIASEVIDKRIIKLKEKEYRLKLEKLVLTEILKLWIKVDSVN